MDELHLIDEIRRGDRRAMHELYSLTVSYLVGVCQRYITNQEDVKDIMQDSYIQIFQHIKDFSPHHHGALKSWMARIVANQSISFLRRENKIRWTDIALASEDIPDDDFDISKVRIEILHKCIRNLPVGYRTVLNLFVFEQKTHKEIAEMLGIKENTSASQFLRAKAMLKQLVTRYNLE